jgi:hypothetical protein
MDWVTWWAASGYRGLGCWEDWAAVGLLHSATALGGVGTARSGDEDEDLTMAPPSRACMAWGAVGGVGEISYCSSRAEAIWLGESRVIMAVRTRLQ